MKKEKKKGKKTLAAVSAVVAAGLTPGFVAASAAGLPSQGSNAGVTAADVVAIDGTTYSFDELYAMQRGDTIEMHIVLEPTNATLYGAIMPTPKKDNRNDDITIFNAVEQMPQYPGGEAALMKYIQDHIKYPPTAAKNNIEGDVIVQFVVKKDGKVGTVMVVSPVNKDLGKEAIRVVKSLPKFTPGRQEGKAVNVWYTLLVPFKLK